jgi:membrane-associated protein
MDHIFEFLKQLFNPESIIRYGGLYLLLFVIFAETGLFIGFFLPGDSLVFTAGLFCSIGILKMPVIELILLIIIAAVTGNMVGYAFGKKVGVMLFKRKSGIFFKHEHLILAKEFYKKHKRKAIILSRFLPIVRTFAPIVAGIVKLEYRKFFIYNVAGAVMWVTLLVLCGYFIGEYIPDAKDYLKYIVIFLIVITAIPFLISYIKKKFKSKISQSIID